MLRKKISILLTAAMLAGLMTGCGSAEKNPVESSMTGESTEAQTGEESAGGFRGNRQKKQIYQGRSLIR